MSTINHSEADASRTSSRPSKSEYDVGDEDGVSPFNNNLTRSPSPWDQANQTDETVRGPGWPGDQVLHDPDAFVDTGAGDAEASTEYGSVHVVTADGVSFIVWDYLLHAYSPRVPPVPRLATTLTGDLDNLDPRAAEAWGQLLRFLHKWECTALYSLVLDEVRAAIANKTIYPLMAFYLGAVVHEADICMAALEQEWPQEMAHMDYWWHWHGGSITHYPWMPNHWPLSFWARAVPSIPPVYLSGLMRATGRRKGEKGTKLLVQKFKTEIALKKRDVI